MPENALEIQVGEILRQRGRKLAVAESCTGGLIGHLLTNVPGSSEYFLGGVIAYDNAVKAGSLGVRTATLAREGAVSAQTVREMAAGVRATLGTDYGLAVSGIAGPGGGTPEKPVGQVWIGLSGPAETRAQVFHFQGDRLSIKEQSARAALALLLAALQED